jgi:hypothetical protein
MIVKLTWDEIKTACNEAVVRAINAKSKHIKPAYGMSYGFFDGLKIDILGCLAEIATAKGLNMYWTGRFEIHSPDVGGMIEVKSIDSNKKNLIVHLKSKNSAHISVLTLLHDVRTAEILGWIKTEDGRKEQYLFEGRPGHQIYLVPQNDLNPISELLADGTNV